MVSSDHDAQVLSLCIMRAHATGNLCVRLLNMPDTGLAIVVLNSPRNLSLETAPAFRTPRFSRTALLAIISWMRELFCFRFTFPLLWRRIGWWTCLQRVCYRGVSADVHTITRDLHSSLACHQFHDAHRKTPHSSCVSEEAEGTFARWHEECGV